MAWRNYHEEGLETKGDPRERHAFANGLSQAIFGAQNVAMDAAIEAHDKESWCQKVYKSTLDFVHCETASAWARGDQHWVKDAIATIDFVGPSHSSFPQWLIPRLKEEVRRTWNTLERPQHTRGGFLQKIRGLIGWN